MNHKWPVLTAEQTGRGKRRALAAPGARRCSEPGTLSWRPAPHAHRRGTPPGKPAPRISFPHFYLSTQIKAEPVTEKEEARQAAQPEAGGSAGDRRGRRHAPVTQRPAPGPSPAKSRLSLVGGAAAAASAPAAGAACGLGPPERPVTPSFSILNVTSAGGRARPPATAPPRRGLRVLGPTGTAVSRAPASPGHGSRRCCRAGLVTGVPGRSPVTPHAHCSPHLVPVARQTRRCPLSPRPHLWPGEPNSITAPPGR